MIVHHRSEELLPFHRWQSDNIHLHAPLGVEHANQSIASAIKPFDEIRVGASLNDLPEDLRDDRVRSLAVYLEPTVARDVSTFTLRVGPRIAWMWQWRSIFTGSPLRGFGFGGATGVLLPVGSRVAVDASAAFTGYSFGPASTESFMDRDGKSYASVWEIRIGTVVRLK